MIECPAELAGRRRELQREAVRIWRGRFEAVGARGENRLQRETT